MDRYKQSLCREYFEDCTDEEDILKYIIENKHEEDYKYHLNADGKLHSRYLEEFGCYEPAIIFRGIGIIWSFWLFDGEIKDCLHPFAISVDKQRNNIYSIDYYSLERIQQLLPIYLTYINDSKCNYALYNRFIQDTEVAAIIDDPDIPSHSVSKVSDLFDISQFVMIAPGVVCPLWLDEFASEGNWLVKFKFED